MEKKIHWWWLSLTVNEIIYIINQVVKKFCVSWVEQCSAEGTEFEKREIKREIFNRQNENSERKCSSHWKIACHFWLPSEEVDGSYTTGNN